MEIFAGTSTGIHIVSDHRSEHVLDCPDVRGFLVVENAVLAATAAGIHRSRDGGRSWQPAGLDKLEVWQIGGAPDGTLYAVTQPAGLYRSTDGGDHWSAIGAFASFPGATEWCVPIDPPLPGRARTLIVDQGDPARMWIGVEVGGIMRTTDGGVRWQLVLPGGNPDIHNLVAHPECPNELYVSTGYGRPDSIAEMVEGNAGMFRSDDGGETWSYVWAGVTPRYTRPLCIDPRPPHPLTVASAPSPFSACTDPGGAGAMLFRSDDRGANWRSLGDDAHSPSAANFHGLAPAQHAPGSVLVGTDSGELWRVDANADWEMLAAGLPAVFSILERSARGMAE